MAEYQRFRDLAGQVTEVNEAICDARPAAPLAGAAGRTPPGWRGKRGLFRALAEESAEIGRLAAEAARSLGCGDAGMEAAEAVIRAGLLKLGCGMLGGLLAADRFRGPRVPCGHGHDAEFIAYRDRTVTPSSARSP